jgi:hypothetical protein
MDCATGSRRKVLTGIFDDLRPIGQVSKYTWSVTFAIERDYITRGWTTGVGPHFTTYDLKGETLAARADHLTPAGGLCP